VQVLDRRLPVHIHVDKADDIMTAVRLSEEFGFLRLSLATPRSRERCDLLAAKKVAVVVGPMMVVYDDENAPSTWRSITTRGVDVSIMTRPDVCSSHSLRYQATVAIKHGWTPPPP